MNNMTIAEDVNGENNMTSEIDDIPRNKMQARRQPLSNNQLLHHQLEDDNNEFDEAYNPYIHTGSHQSILQFSKKKTSLGYK